MFRKGQFPGNETAMHNRDTFLYLKWLEHLFKQFKCLFIDAQINLSKFFKAEYKQRYIDESAACSTKKVLNSERDYSNNVRDYKNNVTLLTHVVSLTKLTNTFCSLSLKEIVHNTQ